MKFCSLSNYCELNTSPSENNREFRVKSNKVIKKTQTKKEIWRRSVSCLQLLKSGNAILTKVKTSVFRLPSDKEEYTAWMKAIHCTNIKLSKEPVICERRWPSSYAIALNRKAS